MLLTLHNEKQHAQREHLCELKTSASGMHTEFSSEWPEYRKFKPNQAVLHSNPTKSHFATFTNDNYQLQTSSNTCSNQSPLEAKFFLREVINQNSEHLLSVYTQSCTCLFSTAKMYCCYFSKPRRATRLWFEQAVVWVLLINKTAGDKVWCGNNHTHSWGFNTSNWHILFFNKTKKFNTWIAVKIKGQNIFEDSSLWSKTGQVPETFSVLSFKESSSWIVLIHLSFAKH